MSKFKVFMERTETECTIIEADTAEEAEQLADENYSNYEWDKIEESMTCTISPNFTEEVTDDE